MRIATINGSKALRKESEFGSIEIGKRADLVIRKNTLPESLPGFDPLREVMVSSRSKSIDTVIINGDIVVENGYSTKLDEDEFANEFRVFHQKLIANLEKA